MPPCDSVSCSVSPCSSGLSPSSGFGEQGCHVSHHPNFQDPFSQLEVERERSASRENVLAPLQALKVSPQLRGPRLWGLTTDSEEPRNSAKCVKTFRAPHLFFIREGLL